MNDVNTFLSMINIMWPISQIMLSYILFVFIEMKFIHCYSFYDFCNEVHKHM